MMNNTTRCVSLLLAVVLAAAVTGCSESPQDQYNDATQKLHDAKQNRKDAQQALEKKQQALADARQDVKDAQDDLQSTQKKVVKAKHTVDQSVNDDVLFRTLQGELLNKDNFDNSAISVSVNKRVVKLSGTVPDQDTRKRALKTARSQPGVKNVINSLRVSNPDQNKSNSKKNNNKASGGNTNASSNDSNNGNAQ